MTSIRENIAVDIVSTLEDYTSSVIQLKKVMRAPVDLSDLARTVFPIAIVTTADEDREDITMGGTSITRQGVITYWVDLHVWGEEQDKELNELIELVEESLDVDRTRDNNALDTRITMVRLLEPTSAAPRTSCRVNVEVEYIFTRGAA